jgi:WD40 repeat protein
VTLWDAHTLRPAGELKGMRTTSQAIAFSPDGRLVAASELGDGKRDPALHVWDVRRRTLVWTKRGIGAVSLSFSPDSRLIAGALIQSDTIVVDARSGRREAALHDDDEARSVRFSPDGRVLAIGHYDGAGQLWSTATWTPFGRPLKRHEGRIISLSFSPDGKLLTTSGIDGTVGLWDVATQKPIGSPLAVEPDPNTYIAATLTPDGSRLIAVSNRHRGVSMSVSPEVWKRDACRVAGRELSRAEWKDAVPGHAFRPVCAP